MLPEEYLSPPLFLGLCHSRGPGRPHNLRTYESRLLRVPSRSKGMSRWPEKPAAVLLERRGNREETGFSFIALPTPGAPRRRSFLRTFNAVVRREANYYFIYTSRKKPLARPREPQQRSQQRARPKKRRLMDASEMVDYSDIRARAFAGLSRFYGTPGTLRGRQFRL